MMGFKSITTKTSQRQILWRIIATSHDGNNMVYHHTYANCIWATAIATTMVGLFGNVVAQLA